MAQLPCKTLGTIAVFLSLLVLSACGSPTSVPATGTAAPTQDLAAVRTEAAATVLAQVTLDLASTPSITPIPSATNPPSPSNTPVVTATQGLTATTAAGAPSATSAPAQATKPAATSIPSSPTPTKETDNRAQWVTQTISDGTLFAPGETFTMTWTIKNVGVTTWIAGYMLRFFSGETFGAPKEILLTKDIPPGETVDFTMRMKAPLRAGEFNSVWVMATDKRGNFKEPVYLRIKVAVPPTGSP
jgi:hypothetical protein